MRTILTTTDVHERDRAAYWRELICRSFVQLDCTQVSSRNLKGQIISQSLGAVQLSNVISEQQHVVRSKSQIAHASGSEFLISLQASGEGFVCQNGREARLRPGDFALYDSTQPYNLHFERAFEQLVVKIPRKLMLQHFSAPERVTATTINGTSGMGKIASQFLRTVAGQTESLEVPLHANIANNILEIVATALNLAAPEARISDSSTRTALRQRIMVFIQENLRDPELNPGIIAAAHGISPRYLSKLFEDENMPVSRMMWSRRLEKCRDEMRDPKHIARSISEIAFSWGFNDMSHFSRTFKDKFGQSPRAFRMQTVVH